jgi:hypothetical protein
MCTSFLTEESPELPIFVTLTRELGEEFLGEALTEMVFEKVVY